MNSMFGALPSFSVQSGGARTDTVMRPPMEIVADIGSFTNLSVAIALLIGVLVFLYGIFVFWKMQREPGRYTVIQAVKNLIVGAMLITPASMYSILKRTTVDQNWQHTNNALALNPAQLQQDSAGLQNSFLGRYLPGELTVLFMAILFLIGLWAFARGIYLIRELGEGGQSAGAGKILTHIGGGIILMNIGPATAGFLGIIFQF